MQASSSLTPAMARKIALRYGLRLGTIAGCLVLLSTAVARFIHISTFSLNYIYILAFIACFVAGQQAAKKTRRIDMGTLAGFWAGVAIAILVLVTFLVLVAFTISQDRGSISLSSVVTSVSSGITSALLALIFGAVVGTLGGFIGKIYTENTVSQSATSPQPTSSTEPPLPTPQAIEPTQPSATRQDQA